MEITHEKSSHGRLRGHNPSRIVGTVKTAGEALGDDLDPTLTFPIPGAAGMPPGRMHVLALRPGGARDYPMPLLATARNVGIVSIRVGTVVPVVRFALDVDRRLPVDQPLPPGVGPGPEDWGSAEKPEASAKTVMPVETMMPAETVMPVGSTMPMPPALLTSGPAHSATVISKTTANFVYITSFDYHVVAAEFTLAAYAVPP